MPDKNAFATKRRRMVEKQLQARGIRDPQVLKAMGQVPREAFVPPDLAVDAYADGALPIGHEQTISQPYIVALMIEALGLKGEERVLDIGTGSGYSAAVLAEIAGEVIGIERQPELAEAARERLSRLGYETVDIITGDGSKGWPAKAPYDGILVAAGAPTVPEALRDQLADNGCLVLPVGDTPGWQRLERWRKQPDGRFEVEPLADVRFVPLIGEGGWPEPG